MKQFSHQQLTHSSLKQLLPQSLYQHMLQFINTPPQSQFPHQLGVQHYLPLSQQFITSIPQS